MARLHSRSSKGGRLEPRGSRPGRAGPLQVERLEDRMMLSGATAPRTIDAESGAPAPPPPIVIIAQSPPAAITYQATPSGGIPPGSPWERRIDAHLAEVQAGSFTVGTFAPPADSATALAAVKEIVSAHARADVDSAMSGTVVSIAAPPGFVGVKGLVNAHFSLDMGHLEVDETGSLNMGPMPVMFAWTKATLGPADFMNLEHFRPGFDKGFGNDSRDFTPGPSAFFWYQDMVTPPSILSWPELSESMETASGPSIVGALGLLQPPTVGSGVASTPGSTADASGTSELEEVPPGVDMPESIALAQAVLGVLLAEPSAQSLPVLVGLQQITELLPLRESSLDLTATLLTIFTDTEAERIGPGAPGGEQAGAASPSDPPPWARFVVGLDEAFEERRLAAHDEGSTDDDPSSQDGPWTGEGALVDEAIRSLELEGAAPSLLDGSADSVPVGDEEPPLDDVAAAVSVPLAVFPAFIAGRVGPRRARRREQLETGGPDLD